MDKKINRFDSNTKVHDFRRMAGPIDTLHNITQDSPITRWINGGKNDYGGDMLSPDPRSKVELMAYMQESLLEDGFDPDERFGDVIFECEDGKRYVASLEICVSEATDTYATTGEGVITMEQLRQIQEGMKNND